MDTSSINKLATMKIMNADAEKLKVKVFLEEKKLIKMKVAQDTAYWDLNEKMQQMENNHEKLQQNMAEVQMQHEAISDKYQEELQLRLDTFNKFISTHEVCNVLEDYSERLKDTLTKYKSDQVALSEAYQETGQLVKEIKTEQVQMDEKNRIVVEGLQDKVTLMTDHQNQLLQQFMASKQHADSEVAELRNKLTTASANKEELIFNCNELNKKLDQYKIDIEKKEELNAHLKAELNKILKEYKSQASQARNEFERQKKEVNEGKDEKASLKLALSAREQDTKTLLEHQNALQEKMADLEDEYLASENILNDLKVQIQEASSTNQYLQNNITTLLEEKQSQIQDVDNAKEILNNLKKDILILKTDYAKLQMEKVDLTDELNNTIEQFNNRGTKIEEINGINVILEEKIIELEQALKVDRKLSEERNKELNAIIDVKKKENESKTSSVNQLISEVKTSSDEISKLEVSLKALKKEAEAEKNINKAKEDNMRDTIVQLEALAREKDKELAMNMNIILEMRNEKERNQQTILSMQNKFENIQKTLTKSTPRKSPQPIAELDDNAVMLTPSHKKGQYTQASSGTATRPIERAGHDTRYSLHSDSSEEGDFLDPSEVNRRFDALARGECPPPLSLAAMRQRREGSRTTRPRPRTFGNVRKVTK